MPEALMTPPGILHFAHIFRPRAMKQNNELRYSIILLFRPQDQRTPAFQMLRKAARAAAEEKWGKQLPSNLRSPFRNGKDKAEKYKGFSAQDVYITAWSKEKPGVVDHNLHWIADESGVWAGQVARAQVRPFGYDNSGNKGVSFGLNSLQILRHGERMDGRVSADKAFDAWEDKDGLFKDYEVPDRATAAGGVQVDEDWLDDDGGI